MAFLEAYFDESYAGKSDIVVAGFVSSFDRWAKFAARWKKVLDDNELPYIHLTELKSPNAFPHLSMSERERILNSLLDIIQECATFALSCRISPREYKSIATPKFRSEFGSAYAFAVLGCVQGAGLYLEQQQPDYEALSVFLESGHRNVLQALQSLDNYKRKFAPVDLAALAADHVIKGEEREAPWIRLGTLGLGGKTEMLPLQAADMLAHSVFNPSGAFAHVVLDRVGAGLPYHEGNWTKEAIRQMIGDLSARENDRLQVRKRMHEMSRFLGNVGIKVTVRDDGVTILDTRQQKEISREEFWKMISRYPGAEVFIESKGVEVRLKGPEDHSLLSENPPEDSGLQ